MTLLQHRVTEQADRRPDAGALVFKDRRLSYADLEQESNRLARTPPASRAGTAFASSAPSLRRRSSRSSRS